MVVALHCCGCKGVEVQTAILVLGFNRPRLLKKLLEKIILFQDRKVYISIDGPRNTGDEIMVNEVQKLVVELVEGNSNMEIKYRFSEKNLGCKYGVSAGIDWGFEHEDSLIILEDDILISRDFFNFMDYHLTHSKMNKQIWHVNGFSPLLPPYLNQSAYLTRFAHVWGWGTWKDRWIQYDQELAHYVPSDLRKLPTLISKPLGNEIESFFTRNLVACQQGFDTWDFQWQFSMWLNGGYAIAPRERLSGNNGFSPSASHTKFAGFRGLNLPPRPKTSDLLTNSKISPQSERLERFHEEIIFGIKTGNSKIVFSPKIKLLIFIKSFPKWLALLFSRARKKIKSIF